MDYPWKVISSLEMHNSRINKESIIRHQVELKNDAFFSGIRIALDPLITFGLKQIPEKTANDGPGLSWENFSLMITGFVNRSFTGNTARDVINKMMELSTKEQWNYWYRRILIKDLRAGLGIKTINKVLEKEWPHHLIPIYSVQLAHDGTQHEDKIRGKRLIESKLDGVRVITVVYPGGPVQQFSRNGRELTNFTRVVESFGSLAHTLSEPMVFDGEIMSASFQDLMKQVYRKSDVDTDDATLWLFDMLPLSEFQSGRSSKTQLERTEALLSWFDEHVQSDDLVDNLRVVHAELVDLGSDEGRERFQTLNREAISMGLEGIMVKDPGAQYECKRSHSWLKIKPVIEVSLTIIDLEEGTGKYAGQLGALVCTGRDSHDGQEVEIRVNVGSGFTDAQRVEFWSARDEMVGQMVEIRADAVTQNQDGGYSLRFPRFIRFRGLVGGEKL